MSDDAPSSCQCAAPGPTKTGAPTPLDTYIRATTRALIDIALGFIEMNPHISPDEIVPHLDEETLRIGQLRRLVEYAMTATSADELLFLADIEHAPPARQDHRRSTGDHTRRDGA